MIARGRSAALPAARAQPSNSWIDSYTGHRVIKLTDEDNSKSLYFNNNAFSPDGTEMIYTAIQDIRTGAESVYVLDLTDYKTRQLVAGPVNSLVVGRKSPTVYFTRPGDTGLYVAGMKTGKIAKIAELPARATLSTLNADETLAAGTYTEADPPAHPVDPSLKVSSIRATQMDARLADHVPMVIFTLNLQTAEITKVIHSTDWLSHVQFSPKDPTLLMYCHEGLWWKVDRIWTIRTDGTHRTR
jgi:oligogalacturonide lyase